MRRGFLLVVLVLAAALAGPSFAQDAPADELRAGVGRADLTSPTGYYMQGWVRSDAVLRGVHTRIQARAVVLQRGGKKLALVAVRLNGVSNRRYAGSGAHRPARTSSTPTGTPTKATSRPGSSATARRGPRKSDAPKPGRCWRRGPTRAAA